MPGMNDPIEYVIKTGPPESFGWVRRPEFDQDGGVCYEKPNGELIMWSNRVPRMMQRLVPPKGLSERGRRK